MADSPSCRACGGDTELVLDLGEQRLSSFPDPVRYDLIEMSGAGAQRYPLDLWSCSGCTLLQLGTTTPRELLYRDDYGYRSGVSETVREDLASIVKRAKSFHPFARTWLDIGCNDGTLLEMVGREVKRFGVDPVEPLAELARKHADSVTTGYFHASMYGRGSMSVVTSISMFYDLPDPVEFCRQVEHVLAHSGVWIIQQNYALSMLATGALDNISHEHVTYFTLQALEYVLAEAGLAVLDVSYSAINGGCIRTVVGRATEHPIQPSVARARQQERDNLAGARERFAQQASRVLQELKVAVDRCAGGGDMQGVGVLGASTRGGTLLQAAGLGPEQLIAAYERQPGKVGKIWGAVGIPIRSETELGADPQEVPLPAALIVAPWFMREQMVERYRTYVGGGGTLIFPLPELEVVQR